MNGDGQEQRDEKKACSERSQVVPQRLVVGQVDGQERQRDDHAELGRNSRHAGGSGAKRAPAANQVDRPDQKQDGDQVVESEGRSRAG